MCINLYAIDALSQTILHQFVCNTEELICWQIRIFSLMDEPILDAICERLRQKTYINGTKILSQGGVVEKMVFVVRGKLESIEENGIVVPLSEGDACGEELLTWYLEHSSVSRGMVILHTITWPSLDKFLIYHSFLIKISLGENLYVVL